MDILQRYAPVLIFDKKENDFPCTIEHFVESSIYTDDGIRRYFDIDGFNKYISIHDTKNGKLTPDLNMYQREDLSTVPVYSFGRLVTNEDSSKSYYELKYIFLYNYNGNIFCMPCFKIGTHLGDIEHITVRVNYETGKVLKVFFDRHSTEGRMVKFDKLSFDKSEKDRVIVYAANESHASYENIGTTWRLMGFANDHHRGNGIIWRPKVSPIFADGNLITEEIVKSHKNQWAVLYHGKFGTTSPLYNRGWFKNIGDSNQTGNPCWPCIK
jgi:hypothetical protein